MPPRNIPCEFSGCNRYFCNLSGLKKHTWTKHAHSFLRPTPIVRTAPSSADDVVDLPSSPPAYTELDEHADFDVDSNMNDPIDDRLSENPQQPFTMLHPFLHGTFYHTFYDANP